MSLFQILNMIRYILINTEIYRHTNKPPRSAVHLLPMSGKVVNGQISSQISLKLGHSTRFEWSLIVMTENERHFYLRFSIAIHIKNIGNIL
jgi:hypothetical protein